ncbi:hypothetical protein KY361_04830 [Candidatus Woesearchaeota archaeon]|nr:hypothetical protein [Candidatus Woesearchaeota archaeon]
MGKKKKGGSKKKALKPGKVEVTIKREAFGEAPEEYHFVLADGKRLKSLYDLASALGKMTEDTFKHHVNEARNDFSNWVNDVFKMPDLAKEISAMNNKVETELSILRKMVDKLRKEVKS